MRGDGDAGVPDRYRALRAVTVVLALLLMVPGVEAIVRVTGCSPQTRAVAAAGVGIDAQALVASDDPFATLDRVEGAAAVGDAEVPGAFAREVGFLPGAAEVRVDGSGTVVGYMAEGPAEDVLGELVAHMEARGWTAVSLGGVDGATFVKREGSCIWALATCTQVGDSTSVVVRCRFS